MISGYTSPNIVITASINASGLLASIDCSVDASEGALGFTSEIDCSLNISLKYDSVTQITYPADLSSYPAAY